MTKATGASSPLALLVTVVLVVRNGERYIAAALESVVDQDYAAKEVLVIDGQSDDRTVEIARGFPGVRVIPQVGRGIADAYNLGVRSAGGEFVAFISHDDVWTPGKLTRQVRILLDDPHVQYVTGRVKFFVEPGCAIPYGFRRELLEGDHVGHIMETLIARRTLFDRVGLFDVALSTAEDVDWFNRARQMSIPAAVTPSVVLRKRIHGGNTSLKVAENNVNLLRALRSGIIRKRRAADA